MASNEEGLAKARLNITFWPGENTLLWRFRVSFRCRFSALNLEELKREARSLRPESKRIDFSIERENYKQKQSRLSSRPDFDVNLSHHYIEGEPFSWSFHRISAPAFPVQAAPER